MIDTNYHGHRRAFPATNDAKEDERGMSLRDWFAGQALVSCFAVTMAGESDAAIARSCFDIADAMIKEGCRDQ